MKNLEILDVFEILAKMPEGPFCQIQAHIKVCCLLLKVMTYALKGSV